MATSSPIHAVNTTGQCQTCGSMRQTTRVEYHRNIGMLVARQTKKLHADMCKTCVSKHYWDFTVKNLAFGPWGMISLIITPIYLVTNTVSYVSANRRLRGVVE